MKKRKLCDALLPASIFTRSAKAEFCRLVKLSKLQSSEKFLQRWASSKITELFAACEWETEEESDTWGEEYEAKVIAIFD